MPLLKNCAYAGCRETVPFGVKYCEKHKNADAVFKRNRDKASQREKTAARGYGSPWRRARAEFLKRHPLCKKCEENGRITLAEVVDHVIPHKGDKQLFWDQNNWQPLCKPCHDIKTATEDGGFGKNYK